MSNALLNPFNNPARLQLLNQRAATVMSVLLVLAIAWLLAQITWLFFPQEDSTVTPRPAQTAPAINRNAQQQAFRQLTAAHLFGLNEARPQPKQTRAPETKLNLTLKGVLAAEPMKQAVAIIAQGRTGREDVYGIGDKLKGGVTIKEIHPGYVILDRRGKLETLKLQKQSGLGAGAMTRTDGRLNSLKPRTPGQALAQIRQNILKSPTSFGDYALPVVVKKNGKQIGYRLQPQSKGELLTELGLQPSDIITQINGVKLDKPQNGISALRKLSTASQLSLMVQRNGTQVPLNIQLK